MKKILLLLLAITILLTSWGYKGHQAVAVIADNHLSPQAHRAVKALLGDQSLSDIAAWADEVRGQAQYKKTGNWHFLNLPLGVDIPMILTPLRQSKVTPLS